MYSKLEENFMHVLLMRVVRDVNYYGTICGEKCLF